MLVSTDGRNNSNVDDPGENRPISVTEEVEIKKKHWRAKVSDKNCKSYATIRRVTIFQLWNRKVASDHSATYFKE